MRIRFVLTGLATLAAASLAFAGDWPQWRGPDRTDVSTETGLLKTWPAGGPKQLWMYTDAGQGYAGFSVADGRLYTMGARGNDEYVVCVDANTGEEKWVAKAGGKLSNGWGDGPRSTPTVDGERVYALGGQGGIVCVSAKDGSQVWRRTMQEFGGGVPGWGYCESVLVDGDKVLCTPGGDKGAMVALDKNTGEPIWQAKDFKSGAQYSSIIVAEHGGKRQYIQRTMDKLVGVDAGNGDVLWSVDVEGRTAMIPTPIFMDGRVYIAGGYGVGCRQIQLDAGNKPTDVFTNKVMKNHHGGVILVGEHLYGYSDGPGWTCQKWSDGEAAWSEDRKLGKGAIACADGMFYCVGEDDGQVVLIEASPAGWKEHGRFTLGPQTKQRNPKGKIWVHPVIANGKLYLRDQEIVYCFDVKAK